MDTQYQEKKKVFEPRLEDLIYEDGVNYQL